jgi:uncharacterized coiled-coil protein SlyX
MEEDLDARVTSLEKRVTTLETTEKNRLTHATTACFEDALAVLVDVLVTQKEQEEYSKSRLKSLLEILQQGRKGPYSYDPDRPAGERGKKK